MPSIIEGYNYDIFISYRQKDNKGGRQGAPSYGATQSREAGWVSEFVEAMKTELESTFKEEISVYFDINPNDGLLETHEVDASLKDKLKCLIFIPIISRTYCDPKSFAWEHEFKAFVELASQDQFVLKVKLPNGNVANRVLPVRIHDLDETDIRLCESVLGGVLRGVDFIYKAAGVNRPLRANEDHPHDNLNKTYYRDQINKVANAVNDIIYCLIPGSKAPRSQQKQPAIELQEFKETIQDNSTGCFEDKSNSTSTRIKVTFSKRWGLAIFFGGFLLGILCLWGLLKPFSDNSTKSPIHSTIPVESFLIDGLGQFSQFAISPNGRTIAVCYDKGIQLRFLSDFSTRLLEGTEGAAQVIFSPDGQFLAFTQKQDLKKIGISGYPVSTICSVRLYQGMSWGIDGNIYFTPSLGTEGIWRIPANGGESEHLTSVIDSFGEIAHTWPQLLPDSKTLLYTALGPSDGSLDSRIIIQDLESGERKILVDKAMFGYYLSNGKLIFTNNDGNIFIVPLDLRKLKIKGDPEAVLSGVNTATCTGAAFLSVSETGNLLYLPRNSIPLNNLDVLDRSGRLIENDSISQKTLEMMGYGWSGISISPSGKLLTCTGRTYGSSDIWRLNLEAKDAERITYNTVEEEFPVWSPDGKTIIYTSSFTANDRRLLIENTDNPGNPKMIRSWPRHIHVTSWSTDGKWLAAYDYTSAKGTDCYALSFDSGKYIPITTSQYNELNGQFSPDGKWFAYQSDESGQFEIYVVPFPKLENNGKYLQMVV